MPTKLREAHILKQVEDYLTARRLFWGRLNTGRIFMEKRVFRAHSFGPGCADIIVPGPGTVWIETKAGDRQQTLAQRYFEELVLEHGHRYRLVRSVDDLEGWL
jgi:hypothetical protein